MIIQMVLSKIMPYICYSYITSSWKIYAMHFFWYILGKYTTRIFTDFTSSCWRISFIWLYYQFLANLPHVLLMTTPRVLDKLTPYICHGFQGCLYSDDIMSAMASQIPSLSIVYSTVYSGTDQRKHQTSASLAFVRGNDWWLGVVEIIYLLFLFFIYWLQPMRKKGCINLCHWPRPFSYESAGIWVWAQPMGDDVTT